MNRGTSKYQRKLVLAFVAAVVIVTSVVLGIYYIIAPSNQTGNSTSGNQNSSAVFGNQTSNVTSCAAIPAISYIYCPSALRISAVGEPGAFPTYCPLPCASWNFTVGISLDSVKQGQEILLSANLTDLGPNLTISNWTVPYINPTVSAENGTEIWAWDPPVVTYPNRTISGGETFSENVSIPTYQLRAGQSYSIEVAPLPIKFPTPNNYAFTFRFLVS